MNVHHKTVQTNHLLVELGDQNHVCQQNNEMNHAIASIVAHIHLVKEVDQMKIIVGVLVRKHV
jgi:hypothetical protein